ncbi:hypothetical protein DL96DRAFT_1714033 [Flagelloscypha sp. PMI_526]|nr:hypothetical protein DL96DRAFT_1714033 [Flagelloscypha sp. PMI_526]
MFSTLLTGLFLASHVSAIQKADVGSVDWHQALIGIPTQPFSIHNGLAIAPTDAGVVAALHLSNGSVAWRHVLPASERLSGYDLNPVSQEIAFLSGPGGATLRVISAETGALLQDTRLHKLEQGILTEPIHAASDVVLLPDGSTFTLTDGVRVTRHSASGEIQWTYPATSSQKPVTKLLTKLVLPAYDSPHIYAVSLEKASSHTSLSLLVFSTATGEVTPVAIPSPYVHVSEHPQMVVLEKGTLVWLEEGLAAIKYLELPPAGIQKPKPLVFRVDKAYNAIEAIGNGLIAGFTFRCNPPNAVRCATARTEQDFTPTSCIINPDEPRLVLPSGEEWGIPVFGEVLSYTHLPGPSDVPTVLVSTRQGTIGLITGFPEPPSSIAAASHDGETFVDRLLRHVIIQLPLFVRSFMEDTKVETEEGLYKDSFSFRQLILRTTKNGWIVAIDGKDGTVVWTRELTRQLGTKLKDEKWLLMGDEVILLATNPWKETILYRLNGLTGDVIFQEVFTARPLKTAHILTLPSSNTQTLMVVNEELTVEFLPTRPTAEDGLIGYTPVEVNGGPQWKLQPVWSLDLPGRVLEFQPITPNAGDASAAPAASFGKVIHQKDGGKNVLYKYLNPRLFWTVTAEPAGLFLVDGVKGTIVYSVALPTADVKVELVENWLVYAFLADDNETKAWTIVSVEMYEGEEDALTSSPDASAFVWGPVGNMTTFDRSFLLPHWAGGVTAMKVSTTKRGVAGRDLLGEMEFILFTLNLKLFLFIPQSLQHPRIFWKFRIECSIPRRPPPGKKPTAEELEEGLVPYEPVLFGDGKAGGSKRVLKPCLQALTRIVTTPTLLESTSLVFGYGELDMFLGRVAPSGTFDRLSEGFNKPQLILTTVALTIGIAVVRPIVKKKQLREKWYH